MFNTKMSGVLIFAMSLIFACSSTISSNLSMQEVPANLETSRSADLELQKEVAEIAKAANGKVGVYAVEVETGKSVALNENERFAMQSVVKVPISMAVLKKVEERKLSLDEKIKITAEDFVPTNMRSPIRDNDPNGTEMTVRDLIREAISESDGTASDVLQRVAGDANGVQGYIDSIGISGINVERTHKEFGVTFDLQYANWLTPAAGVGMLQKIYKGAGISKEHREILLKFMTESNNPPNRIVAGVPKGTVVAHKTGSGGTRDGVTSATNDVGIITMPNGNHIAIAVFVGDSRADLATREGVIEKITRAIFDKWSVQKSEPVKGANFNERHTLN